MKFRLFIILVFVTNLCNAQSGYKQGSIIDNFDATVILNKSQQKGTLRDLKKEITILDFFGTWCVPCLKALPVLERIQRNHPNQIAVILISIEKETQLKKFIAARNNFAFPVIVDLNNSISNLFQPPSYPYTIVLNSNNKIIAVTEAAAITEERIQEWLRGKTDTATATLADTTANTTTSPQSDMSLQHSSNSMVALSEQFIYAAKSENETDSYREQLNAISYSDLQAGLATDAVRKAFWINIYNGFTQYFLKANPEQYSNRNKFFKARKIAVAGKTFSLDEIEHDILRRTKVKWSLGYLNKLFPGRKVKALRVNQLDYRIHFALNCGAKSCPPIAFYKPGNIDEQLDVATKAYLTSEASYDSNKNSLKLPAIMGWFRRDFKGKKNMLKLVKKYGIVPEGKKPSISFKKYDWNLFLNNYKN